MSQGPHAWMLERLDAFLTEEQRRSPPEELGRYRVLAGAILFMLANSVLVVVTGPLLPHSLLRMVGGTVLAAGWMSLLVLLRRQSSPRIPALVVCGLLTAACLVAIFAFSRPGPGQASSAEGAPAGIILIPLFTVYLVGVRTGLFFTAFFCLNVGLLRPLSLSDFGALHPVFSEARPWMKGLLDVFLLMVGWSLSALFSAARDATNATLQESERKLRSLIESTDDPVCALDAEGRIVSANSAAKRMFHESSGRELRPGDTLDELAAAQNQVEWRARLNGVLQGQPLRREVSFRVGDRTVELDLSYNPILDETGRPVGVTMFGRDITERKRAEARQSELHRSLMEASRQAGMAEVATGALHNVGNTLNSVNVSASLVLERLRGSRMPMLSRAVDLLEEHAENLPAFFSEDPRGQKLPEYLTSVTHQLSREHGMMVEEMQRLVRNMEHVKAVVAVQQEHARFRGQPEPVPMAELIDDALRLHATSFERSGIRIQRECAELPPVLVERHRLLQILVNLLSNARHALLESGREQKLLSLRVRTSEEGRLRIEVSDNGVGIAPEHMPQLFVHGFTTKKDGHGFGLHSSAMAAEEMGGRLSCASGGRGQGATFTLELPLRHEQARMSG
ncbi:ATP-binding protein [Archangium gephyra]|uniref:two-component system sensor histidine kinase NtrB n=1 Tax=Archangium gephyra TaxID=48 RepID=UPI0035D46068